MIFSAADKTVPAPEAPPDRRRVAVHSLTFLEPSLCSWLFPGAPDGNDVNDGYRCLSSPKRTSQLPFSQSGISSSVPSGTRRLPSTSRTNRHQWSKNTAAMRTAATALKAITATPIIFQVDVVPGAADNSEPCASLVGDTDAGGPSEAGVVALDVDVVWDSTPVVVALVCEAVSFALFVGMLLVDIRGTKFSGSSSVFVEGRLSVGWG